MRSSSPRRRCSTLSGAPIRTRSSPRPVRRSGSPRADGQLGGRAPDDRLGASAVPGPDARQRCRAERLDLRERRAPGRVLARQGAGGRRPSPRARLAGRCSFAPGSPPRPARARTASGDGRPHMDPRVHGRPRRVASRGRGRPRAPSGRPDRIDRGPLLRDGPGQPRRAHRTRCRGHPRQRRRAHRRPDRRGRCELRPRHDRRVHRADRRHGPTAPRPGQRCRDLLQLPPRTVGASSLARFSDGAST